MTVGAGGACTTAPTPACSSPSFSFSPASATPATGASACRPLAGVAATILVHHQSAGRSGARRLGGGVPLDVRRLAPGRGRGPGRQAEARRAPQRRSAGQGADPPQHRGSGARRRRGCAGRLRGCSLQVAPQPAARRWQVCRLQAASGEEGRSRRRRAGGAPRWRAAAVWVAVWAAARIGGRQEDWRRDPVRP